MPEYPKSVRNRASEMMPPCALGLNHFDPGSIHDALCAALMETPPTKQAEAGELAQWQIDAANAFLRECDPYSSWGPSGVVLFAKALFTPPPAEPEDPRLPIWREFMADVRGGTGDTYTAERYRMGRYDHGFPAWIDAHKKAKEAGL